MSDAIRLPYTRDCFVCGHGNTTGLGLRFVYADGRVTARYTPPAEKCGFADLTHGGILSTILDETMGWAPAYEKRRMCVAAELKVRFLKPVHAGTPIVATGRFTADKRLFWLCEGTIANEAGDVLVTARGTYVPMSAEESARIEAETLIYPDGTPPIFGG